MDVTDTMVLDAVRACVNAARNRKSPEDQMRAALSAALAAAWVPVAERMPPTADEYGMPCYVLAWCPGYGEVNVGDWDGTEWCFPNGRLDNSVTHWMPLPAAPKE